MPVSTEYIELERSKILSVLKTKPNNVSLASWAYIDKNNDKDYSSGDTLINQDLKITDLIQHKPITYLGNTYNYVLTINKEDIQQNYKDRIIKDVNVKFDDTDLPEKHDLLSINFSEINNIVQYDNDITVPDAVGDNIDPVLQPSGDGTIGVGDINVYPDSQPDTGQSELGTGSVVFDGPGDFGAGDINIDPFSQPDTGQSELGTGSVVFDGPGLISDMPDSPKQGGDTLYIDNADDIKGDNNFIPTDGVKDSIAIEKPTTGKLIINDFEDGDSINIYGQIISAAELKAGTVQLPDWVVIEFKTNS